MNCAACHITSWGLVPVFEIFLVAFAQYVSYVHKLVKWPSLAKEAVLAFLFRLFGNFSHSAFIAPWIFYSVMFIDCQMDQLRSLLSNRCQFHCIFLTKCYTAPSLRAHTRKTIYSTST